MLIVQADDLGLTSAFNEGVREAYKNGFLCGTTLNPNGFAFEEAVQEIIPECPGLGIGIHLNIVQGRTLRKRLKKNSRICDASGNYKVSFGRLFRAQILGERNIFTEVEDDFRLQIETVLAKGINPDHLSSHRHIHAIPRVFEIVCRLASEYQVPFVRSVLERFYFAGGIRTHLAMGIWYPVNLLKHVTLNMLGARDSSIADRLGIRTNDYFVGVAYTGLMTDATLITGLGALSSVKSGIVEVLLHPCKVMPHHRDHLDDALARRYVSDPARSAELSALTSNNVFEFIRENGWELTSYSRLAGIGGRKDRPGMAAGEATGSIEGTK